MTIEVVENFDGYQAVSELESMYHLDGQGINGELNVTIKKAAGPNTMTGNTQSPRNPPSTLFFKGKDNGTGGAAVWVDIYDEDQTYSQVSSDYKSVAFQFKPVSGERNGAGGDNWGVILSMYGFPGTSATISLRAYHSLELFDPPDNGFPGGGIGLSIFESETGGGADELWDSLADAFEDTATEAGLYWAAGQQDGAFFEYGKWYHIEFRVYMQGASSSVELRVNGVALYKNDNVTLNANGPIERIELRAGHIDGDYFFGSGFSYEVTDLVVQDWSTGFTSWTYPAVVDTLEVTTEVVGEIDFTPETGTDNAAMIADSPHDWDTTYNEANVAADKDRFSTTKEVPYTSINGDVYAVKVQAVLKDTLDLGTRTARAVVFENLTEAQGPTVTLDVSGFQTVWGVFENNPDTSALWTKAEVNGCEAGYEIVS